MRGRKCRRFSSVTFLAGSFAIAFGLGLHLSFAAGPSEQGQEPDELALARKIFTENKCQGCHVLTSEGHFGYTEKGVEIKAKSEGCIGLLTSVTKAAQIPQANWTETQQRHYQDFQSFGCTTCHDVQPGHVGMTKFGAKMSAWHMSCPAVERILNTPPPGK